MDPVSVAASVLTLLGAAATAGRALDRLSSLKHAPDHLIALVNEVSDLRVVLHNVRDAVQERAKTSQDCGNLAYIVQRASLKMSELNRLIYGNLVKTGGTGCNSIADEDTVKASRRSFLRHSGKIKELKDGLKELKLSLLVAMGTLTFSDVSRLKLDICDVSLVASAQPLPSVAQQPTGSETEALKRIIPASGHAAKQSLISRVPDHVSIQRTANVNVGFEDQDIMRAPNEHEVLTSISSSFNEQHGQKQTRIRVAYLFPFWFALRLMVLTTTRASTSFMWKLDFPAVTESTSDLYVQTSLGNVEKIQGMLSMDAGSFNVIDSVANKSPLHIALQFRQISAVSFLLEQGSDMYIQDCNNKTPLDTFYENYFITTGERRMETLLPLFEKYDVFDHWNLRQIHLIILGWSSVDLATYLSISIDEVDVYDSWGRTPLMWAAWRGDSQSVSILLEHGADPHATSFDGNSVLIYATYGGSLECMGLILATGADINHMSRSLLTPAMGGSQLGDNPAIAKVRLTRGAAIEASRHQLFTPLYVAALTNKVESLAFLLDCGASVDVSSWNCSTPLSMAISFSNHRMAEKLIERGADLNTAPAFTVSYLRNAAVFGDEKMIRLFISARPAIDVSLKDSQGSTAEDRMKERLISMGPSDPRSEGLAAAFQELVDICAVEFEKVWRPIEEVLVDDIVEELSEEEEDDEETFHDALEDQQNPKDTAPPAYGVHVTDWEDYAWRDFSLQVTPNISFLDVQGPIKDCTAINGGLPGTANGCMAALLIGVSRMQTFPWHAQRVKETKSMEDATLNHFALTRSNTHRPESTNTSNTLSRTLSMSSGFSSGPTFYSTCSGGSSFALEPPSARHVPTTIDLLFQRVDDRGDITPQDVAKEVEIKAHRPKTWEQRMLEKSRERYRILEERQGELSEEERMVDWGTLGWSLEKGW
ncbi:MAG: hypothetical protein Q9216_003307 [Gyalolechia sp. 2 TL-2023]